MNTTAPELTWYASSGTGWGTCEPYLEQADLHNGYWAEVEPVAPEACAWSVRDARNRNEIMDSGWAAGEEEAKAAVADWAESDLMVEEITAELLSEAFSAYGHTDDAVAHAALAVAATTQIRRA